VTILERIIERKTHEVDRLRRDTGEQALLRAAREAPETRGFAQALRTAERPRVIAEFKRASPSKGLIRADADPAQIARAYEAAGAAALSVLTDSEFFQGSLDDLRAARAAVRLPVIRKDFLIDPIQVLEARAAGADAVLIIASAVDDSWLRELLQCASVAGLDALIEVHARDELDRAIAAGAQLIGINNRDLHTFRTDISVTRLLLPYAEECTVVSESGLDRATTLRELEVEGVDAFLIGEALMREPDPGEALRKIRGAS
jgi:indole-3-glycerol phosphate synthase